MWFSNLKVYEIITFFTWLLFYTYQDDKLKVVSPLSKIQDYVRKKFLKHLVKIYGIVLLYQSLRGFSLRISCILWCWWSECVFLLTGSTYVAPCAATSLGHANNSFVASSIYLTHVPGIDAFQKIFSGMVSYTFLMQHSLTSCHG